MKRLIITIVVFCAFSFMFSTYVSADTYDDLSTQSGAGSLIDSLPDDTRESLENLGVTDADYKLLNDISFNDIIDELINIASSESKTPIKVLSSVIAVMLFYAILYSLKTSSKTTSSEQVLSVCITLSITCILVIPVCNVINYGIGVIKTACDFMVAYIPVMLIITVANGHAVSGASYYSVMIFAGQAVTRISSDIIAPFLKIFLGISVTSVISPDINLTGFIDTTQKLIKWLLGFIMTMFTALLTFKQLITTAMDNVSTRAVRFTLTSLVPVVGSALSDAYKTVQSSVGLLKSGVGVFVVISVAIVFLPVLIQCFFWMFSLNICKSVAQLIDLKEPAMILSSVNTVITTIFAILLCIMSIFIISTALILMLGGAGL